MRHASAIRPRSDARNAGRCVDDLLNAGPRQVPKDQGYLRHSLRPGWLGPALHCCAPTSRFHCSLQKVNGPVPDPEPFPRRSIGPPTGPRNERLPASRPDKHPRSVGRDQPVSAEGRQVSKPSAKTVARGYGEEIESGPGERGASKKSKAGDPQAVSKIPPRDPGKKRQPNHGRRHGLPRRSSADWFRAGVGCTRACSRRRHGSRPALREGQVRS